MKDASVKNFWEKIIEESDVFIEREVGKDLLERVIGLYIRSMKLVD